MLGEVAYLKHIFVFICTSQLNVDLFEFAEMDIANMTQSVCGKLSIVCVPMPGFNDTNVCSYAQPSCPFKANTKETVTVPLPVSKSFPAVSVSP